jgi:predicted nucleotidyltransferase
MVDEAVVDIVQNYLQEVRKAGIRASRAILFGSYAKGEGQADSDIDLLIIAPDFDPHPNRELAARLWRARTVTDSRIEPIAVGEQQWQQNDSSILLEVARREGVEIK